MHQVQPVRRSAFAAVVLVACCVLFPARPPAFATETSTSVDLQAFRDLARAMAASECVDDQQLFVVDGTLVVHSFSGRCSDAGYGVTLFGSTPAHVLCRAGQTIGGQVEHCDTDSALVLFRTILRHLPHEGSEALTIPGHSIEAIRWRPWWQFW